MYDWYKLVEIPPHWRDKLTSIAWDLPNRIELRMMARYGLVDKAFLLEQLEQVGLKEEFRDVAADMMLAMGIRTDLSTRYSKGWITPEEIQSELVASGLSVPVQERMFQWIVKNTGDDRIIEELNLTKAEIIKGVKKGVVSLVEGKQLLIDIGKSDKEAQFILDINIEAAKGSPENYLEFRKLTQEARQALGLTANIPPPELIQADIDLKEAESALSKAKAAKLSAKKVSDLTGVVEAAKILYYQLLQELPKKS